MKTPSKKLSLKKETLKSLTEGQLGHVAGGSIATYTCTCTTRPTSYAQPVAYPQYPVYQYEAQYKISG